MAWARNYAWCHPGRPQGEPGSKIDPLNWIPDRARFTRLSGMTALRPLVIVIPVDRRESRDPVFSVDWIPDRIRFTRLSGMTLFLSALRLDRRTHERDLSNLRIVSASAAMGPLVTPSAHRGNGAERARKAPQCPTGLKPRSRRCHRRGAGALHPPHRRGVRYAA